MHVKTKWTPSGILLWVIAAVVATVVVCAESPRVEDEPEQPDEVVFEVEGVE